MTGWSDHRGEPLASLVGPFPLRPFLEICARRTDGDLLLTSDGSSAMALVVVAGVARFVGEAHLTDYHSPLGAEPDELVAGMIEDQPNVSYDLDSMPAGAARPLAAAFEGAGRRVERTLDQPCRVLDLPGGPESWEAALDAKRRHEVRRKRRRYEREVGEPEFVAGSDYFDAFVALHRSAEGDKGGFMTDDMERFFADLRTVPGARIDALVTGGRVSAAAFGFEDGDAYYLYNSAYDRSLGALAPGIVLIDHLIGRTMRSGRTRFDFLKGSEPYKRRLGAQERPLYRLSVAA